MKKKIFIILIPVFIFVIIFWPQLLVISLWNLETPAKASKLVSELKLQVPEVKTFFQENQEKFNALRNFHDENQGWRYRFYLEDEIIVGIGEETNELEYSSLEECSLLSDNFKKHITAFHQLINGGYIFVTDDGISIKYAVSENDSRALILVKNADKPIATEDTQAYYIEMLDDYWYVGVVYFPRN